MNKHCFTPNNFAKALNKKEAKHFLLTILQHFAKALNNRKQLSINLKLKNSFIQHFKNNYSD